MAGGNVSFCKRHCSASAIPLARRSASGSSGAGRDRGVDHDGGLDRLRHRADDPDAGLHAVFSAHHRQLRARPGDPVDAGNLPGHVLLLHGGATRGAVAAPSLRSRGHGAGRDGAGSGLRRLAAVLHPPHHASHQRKPYRRPGRQRNSGDAGEPDAAPACARRGRSASGASRRRGDSDPERGIGLHPLHRYRRVGGRGQDLPCHLARGAARRSIRTGGDAVVDGHQGEPHHARKTRRDPGCVRPGPGAHAGAGR